MFPLVFYELWILLIRPVVENTTTADASLVKLCIVLIWLSNVMGCFLKHSDFTYKSAQ